MPAVYVHARHRRDCSHADDPQFKRCHCPKHIYWHQDGKLYRKTARTTKWDVAYELARRIEKQLDGNGNGQPSSPSYSTTVRDAVLDYTLPTSVPNSSLPTPLRSSNCYSKSSCSRGAMLTTSSTLKNWI